MGFAALLAIAAVLTPVLPAPHAGADNCPPGPDCPDWNFFMDMRNSGLPGNAGQIIGNGHAVCLRLQAGASPQDVLIWLSSVSGLSLHAASFEMQKAVYWLCPQG